MRLIEFIYVYFRMFGLRWKSVFRIVYSLVFITALILIASAAYETGKKEIKKYSDRVIVTAVMEKGLAENQRNKLLEELSNRKWAGALEYISPEQAQMNFNDYYENSASDLLVKNPFPPVVNISISVAYQNTDAFAGILEELNEIAGIHEFYYRETYINKLFDARKYGTVIIAVIGLVLALIILQLLFLTYKPEFARAGADIEVAHFNHYPTREIPGAAFKLFGKLCFSMTLSIIGIAVVLLPLYYMWPISLPGLSWVAELSIKTIIHTAVISFGLIVLMLIITSLFIRERA